jgi:hypothetical protein
MAYNINVHGDADIVFMPFKDLHDLRFMAGEHFV